MVLLLGNAIILTFEKIDVVESENCNEDFIEIRNKDRKGKLIGIYCGLSPPKDIRHIGALWLYFKSVKPLYNISLITGKGFLVSYELRKYISLNKRLHWK